MYVICAGRSSGNDHDAHGMYENVLFQRGAEQAAPADGLRPPLIRALAFRIAPCQDKILVVPLIVL